MVDDGTAATSRLYARFRFFSRMLDLFIDAIEPVLMRGARGKRFIAVETAENDFAFYRVSGSKAALLGRSSALPEHQRKQGYPRPHHEIELRLHADSVILTTLKIPAEGLPYAGQIVESRLDRMTPWKPDTLLYGFDASAKPGSDGLIAVNFAATSRDIGAAGMARLQAHGLVPSRMGTAAEPLEQRLHIDLLGGKNDTTRHRRRSRTAAATLAISLIVILSAAASAYVSYASSRQVAELDVALATTRNMLVAGSGSAADRERDQMLLSAKTPEKARFMMIDRLSNVIPDNTFLDELDIDKDAIRIAGTSTEASALIEILSSEPAFSDARFVAPVTRQDDGRDRFDITATRAVPRQEATP